MMKPLLYMRKKNLLGSNFYKYSSFSRMVKSVGSAIALEIIDTIPPSIPLGLTVDTPTTNSLNISWSPSTDNIGVAGYKLFRDSIEVTDQPGVTFVDLALDTGRTYTYSVLAYDATGNQSPQSPGVNGTTL